MIKILEYLNSPDFVSFFNLKYFNILKKYNTQKYDNTIFLEGNRNRPKLLFWGYALTTPEISKDKMDQIINIGICLEIIHKASLIIDDIIDKDTYRYGKPAFHVKNGIDQTIAFSVYMIGTSLKLLLDTLNNLSISRKTYDIIFEQFFTLIQSMPLGALKELHLDPKHTNEKALLEISYLETGVLIERSLLIGYYLGQKGNSTAELALSNIGKLCGFLYQTLNDIEPFLNSQKNENHKGKINCDFDNNRKNVVNVYISSLFSDEEKEDISDTNDLVVLYNTLKKHNVFEIIKKRIQTDKDEIFEEISKLRCDKHSNEWAEQFTNAIERIIQKQI